MSGEVIRFRPFEVAAALGVAGILTTLPWATSDYHLGIVTRALVAGSLAMTLHFLVSYARLVSLAHATFYGIGAYTVGLLAAYRDINNIWVSFLIALAFGAVVSVVFALVSLRTSGDAFIILTLALGSMVWTLASSLRSVTGGDEGLLGIRAPSFAPIPWDPTPQLGSYVLGVTVLVLTSLLVHRLRNSPFGHVVVGIRDSASRMDALGYRVRSFQLTAFVICGTAATLPGVVSAYHNRFVSPAELDIVIAVTAVVAVVIGQRSVLGPAYAGVGLVILTEVLREVTDRWTLALGVILVVTAYAACRPGGARAGGADSGRSREALGGPEGDIATGHLQRPHEGQEQS